MMTSDTPSDAPPTAASAPAESTTNTERKLTRSRDQRVIAGVCGGLGRYCGVDPVVFRIGLAVLVFFGGAGAVIYVAGWLFLPEEGDSASPVEALLGRGQSSTSTLTTVILAVLGAIGLSIAFSGESALILALAVLGIVLLARRDPLPWTGPARNVPPGAPAAAPPPAYTPYGPYGGSVGGAPPASPPPYQSPYQSPYQPYQPTVPISVQKPPKAPKPPKPPKERSALGRIVVSATLLVMGLMVAADRLFDVSIPGAVYTAVALGMVGAGLVVGAWFGRARGLIGLGIVLCIALPVSTAASGWDGPGDSIGEQRWAPSSVGAIQPAYEFGIGETTLDLTDVDFTDASTRTRVEVGFGHLLVRVPSDVDVTVRGTAGAGDLMLFGNESNGTDVNRTVTDVGADGPGGGTLRLDVEVGFGAVEVIRG